MTTYPLKKRTEVSVLVMISYRLAKNCGIVVSSIDRYLGGDKMPTHPRNKSTDVNVWGMISYRLSKCCGSVVSLIDRYLGTRRLAVMTMASAAWVSHATTSIGCS